MGGKQVVGRKRHLVTDTQGDALGARVTGADWSDAAGGFALLGDLLPTLPKLQKLYADQTYRGSLADWVQREHGVEVEITGRPPGSRGFVVLPQRWVIERTFGSLGRCRRLAKDYEHLVESSATMLYLAALQLLLNRRGRSPLQPVPYLHYQRAHAP